MKIGILTFHRALNYGAVFQTYALQKTIQDLGAQVDIIDYRAPFNEKRFRRKTLKDFLHFRALYGLFFQNSCKIISRNTYQSFNDRMKYSETVDNHESLEKCCRQYDKIVCGSDQVWNLACTEGDNAYFLPFVQEQEKKIAYAASFGYEVLPVQYVEKYKNWISNFAAVSVREPSGVSIVNKLTGANAEYVVDPTLLIAKSQWESLADFSRVPEQPYLLLYLMSEDRLLINFARKFARKNHLKLTYISERLFPMSGVKNLRDVTPEQWLGLFSKADYIVTNSFHGTAFSINFEKPFFLRYIPRSIANTRLQSIIKEYDLEMRTIESWDGSECDFTMAQKQLLRNKQLSIQFIKDRIISE